MSRIGKKQIILPDTIILDIKDSFIKVTGKYGSLEKKFSDYISFKNENRTLSIFCSNESKEAQSYYGLSRALVNNMIIGVDSLFERTLIAEGIGYKFQLESENLVLSIGFSHPIKLLIPHEINLKLESQNKLSLTSIDKEKLGLFASKIRAIRPPEPYKGKGIRYQNEKIKRKAGKTRK